MFVQIETSVSKNKSVKLFEGQTHINEDIISMKNLMTSGLLKSKYLLISYNNEGIIKKEDWEKLFAPYNVKKYEIKYDTFKGCRNLKKRNNKVIEIMYLVSNK
jgi:adenine-specific DNA methylase